ncbi:MAG: cytochrome B [Bradyrhizobium sp. 35-63-5]|nr:MAG: cytochrome B [Bradyrhizobium sp. 35-63-5]
MSTINNGIEAGRAMPPATVAATVKVWDPFVRLFHWSLASLFLIAYLTGDAIEKVHIAAGYTIGGLIALRIIWGFVGPKHARFVNFVRSPQVVLAYMRDVALLRAPRYIGHNPAGGVMIIALLVMLAATAATGFSLTTDVFWGVRWLKEVHEVFANLTVGLVVLHVIGVVVASFEHKENLVKAMVTGRKRPV